MVIHPVGLHLTLQSSENLLEISDGILVYARLSMGGDIIPEQKRQAQLLWVLLQGPYKIHKHFCTLCRLKCVQSLAKLKT